MVGANFANFINVSSSTSLALGMVAWNGVSEAVAVEGRVLNGNDIVKSMAFIPGCCICCSIHFIIGLSVLRQPSVVMCGVPAGTASGFDAYKLLFWIGTPQG